MTEVYAHQVPVLLTGLDGVRLVGLGGTQLISGLALRATWEREEVGVLPGTVIDQPPPVSGTWSREQIDIPASVAIDFKG